ncbi:hypothetical protein BH09ACT10_BH09ACT10_20180 [soil metagenome]
MAMVHCHAGTHEAQFRDMTPEDVAKAPRVRFRDITSLDGTRLRVWDNGAEGPTVFLCNGLGTTAHMWPALVDPDCGVHVVSWNHRGVGGSERPANGRVDLDSVLEDAIAVMDDAEIESAVIASWSFGVTVAFELAARYPSRVRGILAVAGVPGDTFSTMLAPLRIPRPVSKAVMVTVAKGAWLGRRALAPVTRRVPWVPATTNLVRHSGIINPAADPVHVQLAVKEFFANDFGWYTFMALAASKHGRVPLAGIRVPTTFIAGKRDIVAGARDIQAASERIPESRFQLLDGTHFLTLEFPHVVHGELHALLARAGN